jgi:hypothetical protein
VLKAQRRALAAPVPPPPAPPVAPRPARPPLGYAPGYHPLRAMIHRGAARLRVMVRTEDAIRHAATAAAAAAASATVTAARAALALRRASTPKPRLLPLRHGLFVREDSLELVSAEEVGALRARVGGPRQPQAP